jgi:hypothetical protein
MIPADVHKIGQATWLDVREHPSNIIILTCEPEDVRPTLLPYEKRVQDHEEILNILNRTQNVIIITKDTTTLPDNITSHDSAMIRQFPPDRLLRQVPRKVYIWLQWFQHSNNERAKEFQEAFENNVKCDLVDYVVQLSEKDYSEPFLKHDKIITIQHKERVSYNSFFKHARESDSEPYDFHVLMNADMEWTREASLGLEHCLWEKEKLAISPLRWEDKKTIFRVRSDSQDAWGFMAETIPDPKRMMMEIGLGKPGCDNRIMMELLVQGFQSLNHPLQFPTIHHHKTAIRNYTTKDRIPNPYLLVRPQWYCPLLDTKDGDEWLTRACLSLRNRVSPLMPDSNVNGMIANAIRKSIPFSIGKIGNIEAETIVQNHQGAVQERQSFGTKQTKYNDRIVKQIHVNAGVFPNDEQGIEAFSRLYQHATSACDILCVSYRWLIPEWGEHISMCRGSKTNQRSCRIGATEPFFSITPYTRELANKKVVVVSPFINSIQKQIKNRKSVWGDRADDFIPETTKWRFVRAPLSAGIVKPIDDDWESMIQRLVRECFPHDREDEWPDVLLAGCGPGGLCLCQEAKERGRVGISLGGSLQILFGVRGKRWDHKTNFQRFQKFFNDSWVRPSGEERPPESVLVENGCYW